MQNYERENSSFLFQYGPTVGSIQFRTKLAEFLSEGYKSEVFGKIKEAAIFFLTLITLYSASDLVLTAGSTYGLHQILTTLIGQDGFIFLDDVTYMIALEAIAQFPSLKIIPIKLNSNGVDIEDLESKVAERKFEAKGKMFWAGKNNFKPLPNVKNNFTLFVLQHVSIHFWIIGWIDST